jgi:prevent-host-death family protein
MANKEIPFSQARQRLTAILDEVEDSGKPITIVRRGRPAAVIISHEVFQTYFGPPKGKRWSLKGSIKVPPGVDLEKALEQQHQENIRMWKSRLKKWKDADSET